MFNNKRIKALEQKIEDLENTIHDLEFALNRESMAYYNRAFEVECEKARTKALNTIIAGKIEWKPNSIDLGVHVESKDKKLYIREREGQYYAAYDNINFNDDIAEGLYILAKTVLQNQKGE